MSTGRLTKRGRVFQGWAKAGMALAGRSGATDGVQERVSLEATSKRRLCVEAVAKTRTGIEGTPKRRLNIEV